jgi:hypothetical protein
MTPRGGLRDEAIPLVFGEVLERGLPGGLPRVPNPRAHETGRGEGGLVTPDIQVKGEARLVAVGGHGFFSCVGRLSRFCRKGAGRAGMGGGREWLTLTTIHLDFILLRG